VRKERRVEETGWWKERVEEKQEEKKQPTKGWKERRNRQKDKN